MIIEAQTRRISLRRTGFPGLIFSRCLLFVLLNFPQLLLGGDVQENVSVTTPIDARKATEQQNVQWQSLAKDSSALERQQSELRAASAEMHIKLQSLQASQVTEALVTQARLDTQTLKLREDEIITDNTNTTQQIKNLEQSIQKLKAQEQLLRNPVKTEEGGDNLVEQLKLNQDMLSKKQAALELAKQHLVIGQEWLDLNQKKRILAEQWQLKVEEYYHVQQEQSRQEAQQALSTELSRTRQTLLERADESRQRLRQDHGQLGDMHRLLLDINTQGAEEQAKLVSLDEQAAKTDNNMAHWLDLVETKNVEPRTLKENFVQLKNLRKTTDDLLNLLERRYQLFTQQRAPLAEQRELNSSDENARHDALKVIDDLLIAIVTRRERLNQQAKNLAEMAERMNNTYQARIKANLLERQPWPQSAEEWWNLVTGLVKAPAIIWHQIKLSMEATFRQAATASFTQWIFLIASELFLAILWKFGQRVLFRIEQRAVSRLAQGIPVTSWRTALRILRGNARGIILAAMLIAIPWWFQAPGPSLAIITTLTLVIPIFKAQTNLVWLLWAAPEVPLERRSHGFYRRMIVLLASVELLGVITLLSHLTVLQNSIIAAIDGLFMVYWTFMFLPLSKARQALLERLNEFFDGRLLSQYLRIISQPLWMVLWIASVVGLVGYLNLAWAIADYWLLLVSVLITGMILHGLLDDLNIFLKNYALDHAVFGLLWTQEIIVPLARGLRILLVLGGGFVLLTLSGLGDLVVGKIGWEPFLGIISAILLGNLLLLVFVGLIIERLGSALGNTIIRYGRKPVGMILASVALQFFLPWLRLTTEWQPLLQQILEVARIVGISWLSDRLMAMVEEIVSERCRFDVRDNLKSRRVQTQVQILRRIVTIIVYLVTIAAILMTFPQARKIGTGLLASAGVAGLVAGVAARQILENLIAGIQIGLTQPIRLDDVVVVEGEWGRIAEIRATYVVVELWDKRHFVLPINYFITHPFQNWTRIDSDLLGTVSFYVDYTFPVDEGRRELKRILTDSPLWDGQTWGLDVTNTSDRSMELRALMSATDASSIWNLRCLVRERFLSFLQREYPNCLPRMRSEQ
ncbi:ABC-2 type transport system permease protein [Gammaproteobacteria bacterium]